MNSKSTFLKVKEVFKKFNRLFKVKKNIGSKVLGIDLGSYSIKIAEVELKNNEITLNSFVQVRTYKSAIINGIINDPTYLVSNIKSGVKNLKVSKALVNVSFPYDLVIFDFFKTDTLPEENQIVEKINEEIPYKVEDVYYSYYIVPEKEGYKVFFLVAKKDLIEQYIKLMAEVNLKVNNIDADFISLHNLCEYLQYKKSKVIIDWGYSKVKVLFYDKEFPVYGRELFNLGFQKLEKELIKQFGISLDKAQELIVNPDKEKDNIKFKEVYVSYLKEVITEIKDTVEFIRDKFSIDTELVFLVGGGARLPGICEVIKEILKIETQTLKVQDFIKVSENFDPKYLKIVNTQGAIAIAAAVREFL